MTTAAQDYEVAILGNPYEPNKKPSRQGAVDAFKKLQTKFDDFSFEGVTVNAQPEFVSSFDVLTSLDIAFSFSRNSSSFARNPDGNLTLIASDTPAYEYDFYGNLKGIQLFSEFEQILPTASINDLTNSKWLPVRCSVVSDVEIGPNGTSQDFDKILVNDDDNVTHYITLNNSTFEAGETYCLSFFAKPDEIEWLRVSSGSSVDFENFFINLSTGGIFDLEENTTIVKTELYKNGLVRVSVLWKQTLTTTTGDITFWLSNGFNLIVSGDGASGFHMGYVNVSKSLTHVPYYSVAGIRAADELTINKEFIGYDDNIGSAYFEGSVERSLKDGQVELRPFFLARDGFEGFSALAIEDDTVSFKRKNSSINVRKYADANDIYENVKFAGTWGQDGLIVKTDIDNNETKSSADFTIDSSLLSFGKGTLTDAGFLDYHMNGHLKKFAFWNIVISLDDLEKITTYGYKPPLSVLNTPDLIRHNIESVIRVNDLIGDRDFSEQSTFDVVQDAINNGVGKTVVFNSPYGSTGRPYVFTDRAFVGFSVPTTVDVQGDASSPLDASMITNSGDVIEMFTSSGSSIVFGSIGVNCLKGETVLPIGATAVTAIEPSIGDRVKISSNALFIAGGTASTEQRGEIAIVIAVSATTVTIDKPLQDDYLVADTATIEKLAMNKGNSFGGLLMIGCGQFNTVTIGDRGFDLRLMEDLTIEGCETRYFDDGNYFYSCIDGEIKNFKALFQPDDGRGLNQYGLGLVNACQNMKVNSASISGGKHGVVLTESSLHRGVARDNHIINCEIKHTWNFGIATHTNSEILNVSHNTLIGCSGGIEMGCRKVHSSYNNIRDLPFGNIGVGIAVTDIAEQCRSANDTVEGGRFGFRLDTVAFPLLSGSVGPFDIEVSDFTAKQFSHCGVCFNYDGTPIRENIRMKNITTIDAGYNGGGAETQPKSIEVIGNFERVSINGANLSSLSSNTAVCIDFDGVSNSDIHNVLHHNHTGTRVVNFANVAQTNIRSI